jgi:hypothetical protein
LGNHEAIGLESLRSVLEEDAKFPVTKSELIEKQGWKVFDLTRHVKMNMPSRIEPKLLFK